PSPHNDYRGVVLHSVQQLRSPRSYHVSTDNGQGEQEVARCRHSWTYTRECTLRHSSSPMPIRKISRPRRVPEWSTYAIGSTPRRERSYALRPARTSSRPRPRTR